MGGSVNVIVREKDGAVSKMCRWTNNLTSYFHSPQFLKDPDAVLKQYIKDGETSEYNEDGADLAPDGYGLVVIDAVHKLILSHQSYTDLDTVVGAKFSLALNLHTTLDFALQNSPVPFLDKDKFLKLINEKNVTFAPFNLEQISGEEEWQTIEEVYELFMMNGITGSKRILELMETGVKNKTLSEAKLTSYQKVYETLQTTPRTVETWKEFLKTLQSKDDMTFFQINLGEYQVVNFKAPLKMKGEKDNPQESLENFKAKLLELGFTLTEQDLASWDNFLKSYR